MSSHIKKMISAVLVVPAFALAFSFAAAPAASAAFERGLSDGAESAQGKDQQGNASTLFGDGGNDGIFRTVTNVLLFIIGAVAVIMLVIGGIRYTVSGGDQNAVTAAKNTILYAIVGIIVAILAYAAVNFVVDSFTN